MYDTKSIQQLERELVAAEESADVGRRIDALNDLAWALNDTDMRRAYALGENAYALASSSSDGAASSQAGMAYALRTLGYIKQRLGDYPLGMTQLLRAQGIFEALKLDDGLPDVLDGLAGIYAQMGSFPEALAYMHKQLEAAERIGDKRRIANAYNNLAVIYHEMHEYERATATLQDNLRLAAELDYKRIEFLSYGNLAATSLAIGDYEGALENAWSALRVSHGAGFELFEAHALQLIGASYLKLGDSGQAMHFLEQALASTKRLDAKVTEALVLLDIGEAYHEMQQLDRAADYLWQCIVTGQSVDDQRVLVDAHLLLSRVHEQKKDFAAALFHLQQHNSVKELVFSETTDKRLRVLQITHDIETARKEAHIFQLEAQQLEREIGEQRQVEKVLREARDDLEQQVAMRTAELSNTVALLRKEVTERERAEAEIQQMVQTLERRVADRTEELAAFFDLILLAGQAVNLTKIFEQALPRMAEVTRSQAICIHLLDADCHTLRLGGQDGLSFEEMAYLQTIDSAPDFRAWLGYANDPLVTSALPSLALLPSVLRLPAFECYLGAQVRIGQKIEGLLSYFRSTGDGFGVGEVALGMALAEQVGMMVETHRLRENAEAMAIFEERQRLARDLHDSVTQSLYSLTLFSRAGRDAAEDGDADGLKRSLAALEQNTLHALREMRLLLYELRPADLEQEGLVRAIELRLNAVERRANLKLDVRLDELAGLSAGQEVELYHVIVEALNNVVKHAAATSVSVRLTQTGEHLYLRVLDDGRGFDPVQITGGMGLRNIRERVARLNGQITITSQRGGGTRLEARIPCRVEEDR